MASLTDARYIIWMHRPSTRNTVYKASYSMLRITRNIVGSVSTDLFACSPFPVELALADRKMSLSSLQGHTLKLHRHISGPSEDRVHQRNRLRDRHFKNNTTQLKNHLPNPVCFSIWILFCSLRYYLVLSCVCVHKGCVFNYSSLNLERR